MMEPTPAACPCTKVSAPSNIHDQVISWAHTSLSSGHPGISCTIQLLTPKYWWPNLASDLWFLCFLLLPTMEAAQHLSSGMLLLMQVLEHTWSHLAVAYCNLGIGRLLFQVLSPDHIPTIHLLYPLPSRLWSPCATMSSITMARGHPVRPWPAVYLPGMECVPEEAGSLHNPPHGIPPRFKWAGREDQPGPGKVLQTYCHNDHQGRSHFLSWAEYAHNSLYHSFTGISLFHGVSPFHVSLVTNLPCVPAIPTIQKSRRSTSIVVARTTPTTNWGIGYGSPRGF